MVPGCIKIEIAPINTVLLNTFFKLMHIVLQIEIKLGLCFIDSKILI